MHFFHFSGLSTIAGRDAEEFRHAMTTLLCVVDNPALSIRSECGIDVINSKITCEENLEIPLLVRMSTSEQSGDVLTFCGE